MSLLWKNASSPITLSHEDHGTYGRLFAHHSDEHEPIGVLAFTNPGDGTVGIDNIRTRPEYARQGVASTLLDTLRQIHPGASLVTSDLSPEGRVFNDAYRSSRGVGMTATSPGSWYKTASSKGPLVGHDELNEHYHNLYEAEGDEDDGDPDGYGWAASYLAHSTPDDPEGQDHTHWDLDWHREKVPVDKIDHATAEPGDSRVASARRGYASGAKMPPPLLVKRHGVYHVADGHHRAQAAKAEGMTHLESFVAHSPYDDKPFGERDY